jgi:hypothetical protein
MGAREAPSPRGQSRPRGQGRARRREKWESLFAPWALAAAGAAISIAYLFQHSLAIRAAMFLVFLGAAWLSGKRLSILATLLVSAGIVGANLLVPVGRVLASLGPFRITETALMDGLGKALVFEGLVHISKASILPGLRLPGRFGSLVASSFLYYDRIVEFKGTIKPATLISEADSLMLKMWDEPIAGQSPERRPVGRPFGLIALAILVLSAYATLFISF